MLIKSRIAAKSLVFVIYNRGGVLAGTTEAALRGESTTCRSSRQHSVI
eukprot:SAG11_NODE_28865_length_317_cov_0.669725_1_plen_47_part_01